MHLFWLKIGCYNSNHLARKYMNTYKIQAFIWRHQVSLGLISVSELVAWADTMVEHESEVPLWIIDLCVSKTVTDAVAALQSNIEATSEEGDWGLLKGIIKDGLETEKLTTEQAFAYLCEHAPSSEEDLIFQINQAYDDLEMGYGSMEEIRNDVLKYLRGETLE